MDASVRSDTPDDGSGTRHVALSVVLATCMHHPTPMVVIGGVGGEARGNQACAALLADARSPVDVTRGQPWPELVEALCGEHLAGPRQGTILVPRADGQDRFLRCLSAPIPDSGGLPAGALVVLQEVSGGGADRHDWPAVGHGGASGRSPRTANASDLADLSSLDVRTICAALGRLIVPGHAEWAIIWLRTVDRAGRRHLDRRDVPAAPRRRGKGASLLAARLGVPRVIDSGTPSARHTPPGFDLPAGPVLTLPLRDKRGSVGALTLGRPSIAADDPVAQDLADRAGVALAQAARFRLAHTVSRDLQRLLEPRPLPAVRGVDMAGRWIAGGQGLTIGGDWYEVCQLPDGSVALTIGDVIGHGLRSAVEMAQLRTGIRNLALDMLPPADVLAAADEFLRRTGQARFVTCIHAVYRPRSGVLDMANAGHPLPIHLPVAGRPHAVDMGAGVPLGGASDLARSVSRDAVGVCSMVLEPGESVLMFTDGLVESRLRPVSDEIDALIELLAGITSSAPESDSGHRPRSHKDPLNAEQLCSLLLPSPPGADGSDRDDAAVLVVRRPPS